MGIESYAILNDVHFPFEDKQRYALALKIMSHVKPSHIYLNGDIGEFQGVSSWPMHPASNLYLRHEPLAGRANHAKTTAEKSYMDIAGLKPYSNKAYSLGYLGDKSRHVFDYRGASDNWTVGFTIIQCETKTGQYELDFIRLEKIPVFYRGQMFDLKGGQRER